MEASALQAPAQLARNRLSIGASLLRLRSDEQLVALFRQGHDEAFRIIHDRYRQRLFAYTRQMLPGARQDAEDALQDIFVRAYSGLRANDRDLALRAWLYRVAHNRCIDELRRPALPIPEVMNLMRSQIRDPIAEAEQRESLRRLICDVRRLPDQQRSALLMRELGGVTYADIAAALGVSVPAVKSLLVRARVSLAHAVEARDTACSAIREDLMTAHDRGVRASGVARRHMHDCQGCREYRQELRGLSRDLAALLPLLGSVPFLAKLLGFGSGAGGGAAAGGSAAVGTGGVVASVGVFAAGAGHVVTLLAAALVTAGGAAEVQHAISSTHVHRSAQAVQPATLVRLTIPSGSSTGQPALAAAGSASSSRVSSGLSLAPSAPVRSVSVSVVVPSSPTAAALPTPPSGAEYFPASPSTTGATSTSASPTPSAAGGSTATVSTAGSGSATVGSSSGTTTGSSTGPSSAPGTGAGTGGGANAGSGTGTSAVPSSTGVSGSGGSSSAASGSSSVTGTSSDTGP